ncbi:MAG: threonine--tRNA ligase [Deltaproteobacteria bacterium]|nr:threonine--tRNA ligase [Deltaproteobacteria bacterium]
MSSHESVGDADQFEARQLSPVETLRHSTAHLMASAIEELFPGTKFAIGPHIDNGFYYDMELPTPLTEGDLPRIEEKMREIAKGNHKFERFTMSREQAVAWADEHGQTFKKELIAGFASDVVSFYKHGAFTDMCAGPHVNYSSKLKHFKLTHIAGAYWRGDEKNPMLTRVYGLAFETKDELEAHLKQLEEAARRDHRRLGKELELFAITQDYGGGLVLWLPNGAFIRRQIEDFWREQHLARGYEILFTPHVAPLALWDRSGHNAHYRDSMFAPMEVEGQPHQLKPMNCPFHIGVYKNRQKSYRDLPVRFAELGTVYRFERSGALHGLMRVRGFTQDDAHIFCTKEQLEAEISGCIDFAQLMYSTFGFPDYKVELSVRDAKDKSKYLGDDAHWDFAEAALAGVLDARGIAYKRIEGEAAFYGPKIDVKVVDAIGRTWQLTTVQLDFNLPERFDMHYIGADNQHHRPFMVHRALLGSLERFFGILIEHYAGDFPIWLAPVQAKVLPISERFADYGQSVVEALKQKGIRAKLDTSDEKLGYKIRKAELDKIPYALVVGAKEAESGTVGVRRRLAGDLGAMSVADFAARVSGEIASRTRS